MLEKYVIYIRNTGRVPLPVDMFDEDWEPIGPKVRTLLVSAGYVTEGADGMRLAARAEQVR